MKVKISVIIFLITITSTCFSYDANNVMVGEVSTQTRFLGLEKVTNFLTIISYWYSFTTAHEQYVQKNLQNPEIRCSKCATKVLTLGELCGGLVGKGLRDLVEGKDNFTQSKAMLDAFLECIQSGSYREVLDFMVCVANETKQVCSHCHSSSDVWVI